MQKNARQVSPEAADSVMRRWDLAHQPFDAEFLARGSGPVRRKSMS